MKYLNSVIITALFAIALNSSAFAAVVAGTTGAPATSFNVTVTKVELCRSSACSNPFVAGQSTKTFDIASAAAGADVGNYISLKGIPTFQTWSHVRVTLSTDFTITANDGTCMTDGTASPSRAAFAAGATAGAAGTETASVLKLPNEALISVGYFDSIGFTQTDNATTFSILYALTTPYTCKGVMPRIDIKFDTSTSFGYVGGAACTSMFPEPPTVTITASDP